MDKLSKVIFDMDGLIFDTEDLFMREQAKVVKEYGYELTREMYVKTLGLTGMALSEMLKSLFGEDYPEKEVTSRVRKRLSEIAESEGLPVKPGIRELLEFLREKEIECVIASSTHTKYIIGYLAAVGLEGYFSAITGGECAKRSKPAPDIFLKALGDTPKAEALVLEDSENGIKAAYAAGIAVICIPDMVMPSKDVISLAECTAGSAADVKEIIRGKYANT